MKRVIISLLIISISFVYSLNAFSLPSSQKKVILITIDTLRPDHLGFNGYPRDTSPNIDQLAKESVVFKNAYTPIPWTVPAHISLLSGLHPIEFGIFNNQFQRVNSTSLANLFKNKGYKTAAFVSSQLVAYEFFRQGFSYFDYKPEMSERDLHRMREKRMQEENLKPPSKRQRPPHFGPRSRSRKGANTNKKALEWLEKNYDQDFFLWIHYFDPVFPYEDDCGRSFRCDIKDSPQIRRGLLERMVSSPTSGSREKISPEEIKLLKARYDEGIFCADKELGEIIERLKKLNIYDDSTIILLSDHGAGFKHYLFHGEILYQEAIKIPLIIKSPLLEPKNESIDTLVSLLDIYPTLVKKFGLENISVSSDYNLYYPIKELPEKRELFFVTLARQRIPEKIKEKTGQDPKVSPEQKFLSKALISGNKKLIIDCLDSELMELYDLSSDPNEEKNLIDIYKYKTLVEKLKNKITTFFKGSY